MDEEQADPADADTAVLYTMELDRVKWLLTRYLRARLRKLERQVLFVMQDPAMLERLSAQERAMAEGFHRLMVGREGGTRQASGKEGGREGRGGGGACLPD